MKLLITILAVCLMTTLSATPVFKCKSNATGNIQFSKNPLQLELKFENKGTFSGDLTELIRISDFHGNGNIPVKRSVKLEKDSILTNKIAIPADHKGAFTVTYSLWRGNDLLFCDSVNGAVLDPVTQRDPAGSPIGMYCHNIQWNGKSELPILRNMGICWVRTNLGWRTNEPQRGDIQWNLADRVHTALKNHGMNVMYNLMGPPKWAVKRINGYGGNPADFKDFAAFAARVAARYPDATYWSLWNEPDAESHWDGGGAEYARMLKTVTPAIRAANPKARVLPGGVTGCPALAEKFMRELHKAGGRPYFDIYEYHYRNVPMHRELIREFGWDGIPLWNSEAAEGQDKAPLLVREIVSGFSVGVKRSFVFLFTIRMNTPSDFEEFTPVNMVDNDKRPTANFPVVYTMSRMLNGIKNCDDISTEDVSIYAYRNGNPGSRYVLWGNRPEIRSTTIKSSGTLRSVDADGTEHKLCPFDGFVSVPISEVSYLSGGNIQPGGKSMAEIGEPKEKPIFGAEFQIPVRFFNPSAKVFKGKARLHASSDWDIAEVEVPLVLAPGEKREVLCRLKPRSLTDCSTSRLNLNMYHDNGNLTGYDFRDIKLSTPLDYSLGSAFRWGEFCVRAAITNPTASPVNASICFSIAGEPDKKSTMPITLPPLKTSYVYFNPDLNNGKTQAKVNAKLSYSCGVLRKSATLNWIAIKPSGNAPIVLKNREDYIAPSRILFQWGGPKDLSAIARMEWNAKYITLVVDVTDDVHSAELDPALLWQRDSLQVWFDGMLFDLGLTKKGAVLFRHNPASEKLDIPFSIVRKDNITTYKVSFPKPDKSGWKENDNVKFAFIVNDGDIGAERKGWLYYLSDIGNHRCRQTTPDITLTK